MVIRYKVAVDGGHGGFKDAIRKIYATPGKRTPDGEPEWSFNNKVVLAIIERLNQYGCFDVIRTDDPTGKTDVPLADRVTKAIKFGADVFTSAHQNANAGEWGSHGGTETYYYGPSTNGKRLANCVNPRLISALGLRNRGVKPSDDLYVLKGFKNVKTVAILTEGAFMDSTTDIGVLRDNAKLKAQGYAIADGIAAYFGVILPSKETQTDVIITEAPVVHAPAPKPVAVAKPKPKFETLEVDGYWGAKTTKRLQEVLGTTADGVISGQIRNDIVDRIEGVQYGNGGSNVIRAMQKKLGVEADGYLGPQTLRALQKRLGTVQDGKLSSPSLVVKALQKRLNENTF